MFASYEIINESIKDFRITSDEKHKILKLCKNKKSYYCNFFTKYIKKSWHPFSLSAFYRVCPSKILYENQEIFKLDDNEYFFSFIIGMIGKTDYKVYWPEKFFTDKLQQTNNEIMQTAIKCVLVKEFNKTNYLPDLMNIVERLNQPNGGNDPVRNLKLPIFMALYEDIYIDTDNIDNKIPEIIIKSYHVEIYLESIKNKRR